MTRFAGNTSRRGALQSAAGGAALLAGWATFGRDASAAGLLDEIKKRGKVVVATEAAYPPFEFVQDGRIVGYGKDILDYVVKGLGVELEQLDLPFQGILPGLLAKKFDFVATTVGMTVERQQKYAFTVPIADGAGAVMKRAGDKRIANAEDLQGKVVGTQLGSAMETIAKQHEEKLKGKGLKGYSELKLFKATPETYLALANGTLDAVVQNSTAIALLIKEKPGIYEMVEPIAEKRYIGWVTRPEDPDMRDYLSKKILELRDSGELGKMQDKWFGMRFQIPDSGFRAPGAV